MFQPIEDAADITQLITLVVWASALVFYLYHIIKRPFSIRLYRLLDALPIITYMAHVVIYYIAVTTQSPGHGSGIYETIDFRLWSATLRLHGGTALLVQGVLAVIHSNRAIEKIIRRAINELE